MSGRSSDCNVCNRQFMNKHALEQHLKTKHPVHCECCLERASYQETINQHVKEKGRKRDHDDKEGGKENG
ncbi:MAG: hypothetical protein ACFFD4_17940 [Candidatus Odinarchaeota archaeon]